MPDVTTATPTDQLALPLFDLRESTQPARFRLDMRTRHRGLAHLAEIRRQVDERRAARQAA